MEIVKELPRGWIEISMVNDLNYVKSGVLEYEGEKEYYSTGSIMEDVVELEGKFNFNNRPSRANRISMHGDIFQARMKNTDKALLIDDRLSEMLFSTGFFQVRTNPDLINNKFIFYYLKSKIFHKIKDGLCSGSTQEALNDNSAKKIMIPLPPLPEQHRIVVKIEELFSELDKGVESLKTAQQQLKVYRQAVLKRAFKGKLTEEWRKKQKKLPTVDELYEIIKYEREKVLKLKNKKIKPVSLVNSEKVLELSELPREWHWNRIGNVVEMCLGKMLDAKKNQGTFKPYLGNINVRWGYFDLQELKEMKFLESEEERYGIKCGDLIVCEGGEPGRCAIWNSRTLDMRIQKALHRLRCFDSVNNKYIYFYFLYSAKSGYLSKYFTGTTIKHLPSEKLETIVFPYCSTLEQAQILQEIESRLSVCDKMEEAIEKSLAQAEALRQSILKKAFEGKLVPQDPSDEPAEKLLERIRAERENQNSTHKPTRKKVKGAVK